MVAPLPGIKAPHWPPLACALSAALVLLSAPPLGLWPLTWLALIPALIAIQRATPRGAFWLGWLFGALLNAGGFSWLFSLLPRFGHLTALSSAPLFLLIIGYQGLCYGLFAYLLRRL